MPPDDVEYFDTYDYLPVTRQFVARDAPLESARDLAQITEGRFIQRGPNIMNGATGRIVGRIAEIRGAFLELGNRGTLLLNNYRGLTDALEPRITRAIPRAEIVGTINLPDGTLLEPVQRTMTLAPRDRVVYVNDQATTTRGRYASFSRGIFGEAGPPLSNEFGRLARPEELLQRSVAGWLTRNAAGFLERAKLTGITLPDGTTTTNGSEIVRVIAASVQISPLVTYVLSEGI